MEPSLRLDFRCPKKVEDLVVFDEGLYCSSCAKPVLDFSGMEKDEIIRTLNRYAESNGPITCTHRTLFYEFDQQNTINHTLKQKPMNLNEKSKTPSPETPAETPPASSETSATPAPESPAAEPVPVIDTQPKAVLLFPNPAADAVTVKLDEPQTATIQLLDLTGNVLLRKRIYYRAEITLDVQAFAPGNYVVSIQYDGKTFTEKLMLVR